MESGETTEGVGGSRLDAWRTNHDKVHPVTAVNIGGQGRVNFGLC
jgi:hypothetical protein